MSKKFKEITKEGNVFKTGLIIYVRGLESYYLPTKRSYLFYVNCQNFINYYFLLAKWILKNKINIIQHPNAEPENVLKKWYWFWA
jgi:hypothetical protein